MTEIKGGQIISKFLIFSRIFNKLKSIKFKKINKKNVLLN